MAQDIENLLLDDVTFRQIVQQVEASYEGKGMGSNGYAEEVQSVRGIWGVTENTSGGWR